MDFRFRKRLKLFPGAWINISKKGGSLSVGGHGATVNFSKRGVSETVGLPGSGISYRTKPVRLGQSRKVSHSHGQHHGAVVRPTGQRRRRSVQDHFWRGVLIGIGILVLLQIVSMCATHH